MPDDEIDHPPVLSPFVVQRETQKPGGVLGLLVVGNLAWVGAVIETLRASIAYDLGARHETAQLSQVLGGLLITGAVWALVPNLGSAALNRGLRRAFRLFSIGYLMLAVAAVLVALDYRRLNVIPASFQWRNAAMGLGSLLQALGFWVWSTSYKRTSPSREP